MLTCWPELRAQLISPWTKWPHFAGDMFKRIFLNENIWNSYKISLKYVHWGLIDNMSALVQIMVRRRSGEKPLSEPMLAQFTDAYMYMHEGRWVKATKVTSRVTVSLLTSDVVFMLCGCNYICRYLTYWGRGKSAAISQTTFSNAFSWMKMNEFRIKFHWSLFLGAQLTILQHWFR